MIHFDCLLVADIGYADSRVSAASPLVPLMAKYKFVFAFENSHQKDYVTEKLYIPLMAGVPLFSIQNHREESIMFMKAQ